MQSSLVLFKRQWYYFLIAIIILVITPWRAEKVSKVGSLKDRDSLKDSKS